MKKINVISVCLLSFSLLGLGGCMTNQTIQPAPNQNNVINNNASTDHHEKGNQQKDPKEIQSNHQKQSSQSSNQNSGTDQTSSGSVSAHSGSTSISKPRNSHTPPKTQQEALNETIVALHTRVPLMLPTKVPVATNKYLTATTKSETWFYQTNFFETDHPVYINSPLALHGIPIATVEGTEYKNDASAEGSISGYIQADPTQGPAIDLGHKIKGIEEGAAGHSYITWNEGRWCIKLDSPNDPAYVNPNDPNSVELAKNIVAYLNVYALPAPQKIGVISINNWNQSTETTITWQFHEMTYQVTSQDPFDALKVAVAMHFVSK